MLLFSLPRQAPVASGNSYPGAKLYFYVSGTSATVAPVYSDAGLTTALSQPVEASASGVFPAIYLDESVAYKVTLTNSAGTLLYTVDPINATGDRQYYGETAAEAGVTIEDYSREPGNVLRYYDGGGDHTVAIQAAIDQGTAGGATPYAPPGTYACTSTVYITGSCNFSDAVFNFGSNYTGKAVVVSPEKSITPAAQLGYATLRLPAVKQTKSAAAWGGVAGSVGIYLVNVWQCRIYIPEVWYFETGVHFYADEKDVTYNATWIGTIYSCKVGLKLSWDTAGAAVGCNQNQFYGGRWHIDSTEGAGRISGTRHIQLVGSATSAPNNNTFIGCSVEGIRDEYAVELNGGCTYNQFIGCRYETGGVAGKTIQLDGANCRWNQFIGGFALGDSSATGVTFTQANGAYSNQHFSPIRTSIEGGESTSPTFAARHINSNAYPSVAAYALGDDMGDRTAYTVALRGTGIGVKSGDNHTADLWTVTNNGAMTWGDGTNAADVSLSRTAANVISLAAGDSFKVDGTWDGGTIRLGSYYLWVSSGGKLYIKSSAPANDTDGTIVGTQS